MFRADSPITGTSGKLAPPLFPDTPGERGSFTPPRAHADLCSSATFTLPQVLTSGFSLSASCRETWPLDQVAEMPHHFMNNRDYHLTEFLIKIINCSLMY